ncbi:MAG: hypothetical protein K0S53_659 [Bacteroidetes bacterium]|jgi:DNA recombination protein RmuC|nr:hypothetical protein [Bacteroidota bacterium]
MEIIIGLIIGGVLGYFIGKFQKAANADTKSTDENYIQKSLYSELYADNKAKGLEIIGLNNQLATFKEKNANLDARLLEHKAEFDEIKNKMSLEFSALSHKIFEEKSSKFLELNEKKVSDILNPLKEKIKDFEAKVDKNYNEDIRDKASLKKELEHIVALNKQIGEDATKLTNALKGDKKLQGGWGEIQLEMILNKAGLEKGIHYTAQPTLVGEEGKTQRPDYVINLPGDKHLILDSKVSLVAYEQFFNEENDIAQTGFLKTHVASISKHISDLGDKNYHKLYNINPPDYVLMFIPIEPALYAALREDNRLFDKALDKNIVLVSTSTLLATLRTISYIWKQENQRQNVAAIAEESGLLYDKFVGFVEDLINLGRKLEGVQSDYSAAMGKLTESKQKGGTIIGRMQKIKSLGANATKSIPANLLNRVEEP